MILYDRRERFEPIRRAFFLYIENGKQQDCNIALTI